MNVVSSIRKHFFEINPTVTGDGTIFDVCVDKKLYRLINFLMNENVLKAMNLLFKRNARVGRRNFNFNI